MFEIHDQTIILTRGDTAYIQPIPADEDTGELYEFQEGDKVYFRLKQLPDVGAVFVKECNIDLADNLCTLTLDPEDTIDFPMTEHRYEFELVTAIGERHTFIANQKFIIGKELEEHAE